MDSRWYHSNPNLYYMSSDDCDHSSNKEKKGKKKSKAKLRVHKRVKDDSELIYRHIGLNSTENGTTTEGKNSPSGRCKGSSNVGKEGKRNFECKCQLGLVQTSKTNPQSTMASSLPFPRRPDWTYPNLMNYPGGTIQGHSPSSAYTSDDRLMWVNAWLRSNYSKIEDLATGTAYCQLMDILYPGSLSLEKVKFQTFTEQHRVGNFLILQTALENVRIDQMLPIGKLVKGCELTNSKFLDWFIKFFNTNYKGQLPTRVHDVNPSGCPIPFCTGGRKLIGYQNVESKRGEDSQSKCRM